MKYILIAVWLTSSGELSADPWREFDSLNKCMFAIGALALQENKNNKTLLISGCRRKDKIWLGIDLGDPDE